MFEAWRLHWNAGVRDDGRWIIFTADPETYEAGQDALEVAVRETDKELSFDYEIVNSDLVSIKEKLPDGSIAENPPFDDWSAQWLIKGILMRDFLRDDYKDKGIEKVTFRNVKTGDVEIYKDPVW